MASVPEADSNEVVEADAGGRSLRQVQEFEGTVGDEVPGHIPAASDINVCALVEVAEVGEALDDGVTDELPGTRDGPNDPLGHCIWGLAKSSNMHILVFTEAGLRLTDPDYSIENVWFKPQRADPSLEWLEGLGDEAFWNQAEGSVNVRVGTAAMIISIPDSVPTGLRTRLERLAATAATRLAAEARKPVVAQPEPGRGGSAAPYLLAEPGVCVSRFQRHPGGGLGITTASCDEPHVAEITAVLDIEYMFPDHYPDVAEQRDAFLTKCPTAAGLYLGLFDEGTVPRNAEALRAALAPLIIAGLDLDGVVSSESVWHGGMKVIVCAIAPGDATTPLTEPASTVLRRASSAPTE